MKNFKSTLLFAAMASSVVCGCEPVSRGKEPAEETGQEEVLPEEHPSIKHLYVSAVEFPDGFDWRSNKVHSSHNGTILLFKDGKEILSIPTWEGEEMCDDADMHHLAGGHIFTEYCSSSETVIKRDGKPFIRYAGCETLKGLVLKGDDLYTLGQDKSGKGFSLRRNGEPLLIVDDGIIHGDMYDYSFSPSGALYLDRGNLCFAYFTSKDQSLRDKRSWYFVEDSKATALEVSDRVTDVYDVKRIDGNLYSVVCEDYHVSPILISDGKRSNFYDSSHGLSRDYRIVRDGKNALIAGSISYTSGKEASTGIWDSKGLRESIPGTGLMVFADGQGLAYVRKQGNTISAYTEDIDETVPEKCQFVLSRQACFSDGHLYLAINPTDRYSNPHLMTDGDYDDYVINGYISAVESSY